MQELLKKIQQSMQELPQAQKNVADYVLLHYMDIPFMTVTTLAKAIGVSDTTIIKFCIQQGFDGFSSFKKVIVEHVQSEVTTYGNLEKRLDNMADNNTLDQVLACSINNLEVTLNNSINRENFEKFLDLLDGARRIYFCGLRTANMQAEYLAFCLQTMNCPVTVLTGNGSFVDQICQVGKEDLFITFAFARYSTNTIRAMEYLKRRGITCAAITDTTASPAYGLADIAFVCESQSYSYQGSYVSCTALIDAIITAYAKRHKDETTIHLRDLEQTFQEFDTFIPYDR